MHLNYPSLKHDACHKNVRLKCKYWFEHQMFSNGSLLHMRKKLYSSHISLLVFLCRSWKKVSMYAIMTEKECDYYEEAGLTRDQVIILIQDWSSPTHLQVTELRKAFDSFDSDKRGAISSETTGTILRISVVTNNQTATVIIQRFE